MMIYQLKITLLDVEPAIWRRLHVPADLRLSDLALVLITSMGWENSHLHQFTIGRVRYAEPDPDGELGETVDEASVTLREIVANRTATFRFLYDFGDDWDHTVKIERLDVEPLPGVDYPTCISGERACPPEDCGGVPGYLNLLKALNDPTHEEHQELRSWVGPRFNAAAFNVTKLNAALARLTGKGKRRKSASRSSAGAN
jgi:hypothetical protein